MTPHATSPLPLALLASFVLGAPLSAESARPRLELLAEGAAAVSTAEIKSIRSYRRCVLDAARRSPTATNAGADPALLALYSCPEKRAESQALIVSIYGLGKKQTLFDALDERLLREARAIVDSTGQTRR
jgi:hypothetical protein